METTIIDGKKMSLKIQEILKKEIQALERKPKLAVILVGDNPASIIYVGNKKKIGENIGAETEVFQLSPVMTEDALISFIEELNQNETIDGILVQLPLPPHFNENKVLEALNPDKDVDGLHPKNLGNLFISNTDLKPCTPLACIELIKSIHPNIEGKTALIIGRSRLVGKPLAQMLLAENCTVIQAHSKTKNMAEICKIADIVVAATGKPNLIESSFIKKGAVLIDVGITRLENKKITGDIDFKSMLGTAGAITPVPGGVGPMTVTMLFVNLLNSYKKNFAKRLK